MTTLNVATDTSSSPINGDATQPEDLTAQGGAHEAQSAPAPASQTPGRENAFAITSFVLGVASIVSGWTFIAPIIGLVFGVLALRRKTSERTLALWGVWLNVAMLALTVLAIAVLAMLAGFALIAGLPVFSDPTVFIG